MTQPIPATFPADHSPNEDDQIISVHEIGVSWGLLNQTHSSYDSDKIDKLKLLLSGKDLKKPINAKKFIKQLRAESKNAYEDRISFAAYENNFGGICNDFGSNLFAKPLAILPAVDGDDPTTPGDEPDPNSPHMKLQAKFTQDGKKMETFLKEIQEESNATSCAYFGMDFNDSKEPFAYYIDPCAVLDWEKDDQGKFIFLILRDDSNVRTKVRQLRNMVTTTFIVWTKDEGDDDGNDAKVRCEEYRVTYPQGKEPPNDQIIKKVLNKDNLDNTVDFKDIPIVDCITPDNLCVGALIGDLAGSLFMRYTTYLFCLNRGINPILVYTQGAELPANGDLSVVNEIEDRGDHAIRTATTRGAALLGPNDKLNFEGADAGPYQVVQEQLEQDKNEMYRLVAQMSSIIGKSGLSTSQTKSSGVAKMIDNQAKENMLTSYAKLVKIWAIRAFKLVFEALGQGEVEWQAKGMDNYKVIDEDQLLAKVAALPTFRANIPSLTSYLQLLNDVAYESHPFTSPAVLTIIQQELAEAVKQMKPAPDPLEQQKELAQAGQNSSKPSDDTDAPPSNTTPPQLNKNGVLEAPEGAHLSTGPDVSSQVIFDQLKDDYNEKDIQWVKQAAWKGPMAIPLSSIDFSNVANWQASEEPDKVDKFAKMISNDGFDKPIILANVNHDNNKMVILDGHHRALAYQQSGQPAMAYVAQVGMISPEMAKMHSKQAGSNQQSSNQTQSSQQKAN